MRRVCLACDENLEFEECTCIQIMRELEVEDRDRRLTIIYHNNCYDGVTAAWVCMNRFSAERPNLRAIPRNYSDPIPEDIDGDDVIVVDFSWKRPVMEELYHRVNSLIVLDHHKTAEAELANFGPDEAKEVSKLDIVFDMNRSGAGLAWDYFVGGFRPELVNYVEDRDLWRYTLPNSRIINAYIQSYDIDLVLWLNTFDKFDLNTVSNLAAGEALLRQQSKLVRSIVYNAHYQHLPTPWTITDEVEEVFKEMKLHHNLGIYVDTSILMSEVCEEMLNRFPAAPFSFYSFRRADGKRQYGLRSRTGSDVDVSRIAKMYGGGGHRNAAGFEL